MSRIHHLEFDVVTCFHLKIFSFLSGFRSWSGTQDLKLTRRIAGEICVIFLK